MTKAELERLTHECFEHLSHAAPELRGIVVYVCDAGAGETDLLVAANGIPKRAAATLARNELELYLRNQCGD